MQKLDTPRVVEYLLQTHQVSLHILVLRVTQIEISSRNLKIKCNVNCVSSQIYQSVFLIQISHRVMPMKTGFCREIGQLIIHVHHIGIRSCPQSSPKHVQFIVSPCPWSTPRLLLFKLSIRYWLYPFLWLKDISDHAASHVTCLTINHARTIQPFIQLIRQPPTI